MEHPAKYSDELLPVMARLLAGCTRVLDPMAGTGRIFELESMLPGVAFSAIEIEPEWCAMHPRTTQGDALCLPWPDGWFDGICVSPCYGNRMADHFVARDSSKRRTYTHVLGRTLHANNAGSLQWGARYRLFHRAAWVEARRVLQPGGKFVLNIKDHIRNGRRQLVTSWHIATLLELGFQLVDHIQVDCPGMRYGQHRDARIDYESVILFTLNATPLSETTYAMGKTR